MARRFLWWGVTLAVMVGCSGRRFASSEIVAILKLGFGPTAFPICRCAPLNRKPFGGFTLHPTSQSANPSYARCQRHILGLCCLYT